MKKIICGVLLSAISVTALAKKPNLIEQLSQVSPTDLQSCKVNSLNLLIADQNFKTEFDKELSTFGSMKSKVFDKGRCLSSTNIHKNLITAYFEQDKSSTVGHKFKSYVVYDIESKKLLVVLMDSEDKTYILGDRKPIYLEQLLQDFSNDEYFKKANLTSNLVFSDLNEKVRSDKVKNEEALLTNELNKQNDNLVDKASKSIKKRNSKDLIKSDKNFDLLVNDGEGKKVNIKVFVKLNKDIDVPLSKAEIQQIINFTSGLTQIGLKNPYSFRPREVLINQEYTTIEYIMRYTAKNGYGADVVNVTNNILYLQADGKYSPKPK